VARDTDIQWCDSTVNPVMGCEGCELWCGERRSCYAGMLHEGRGKGNKGFAPTFEQVTEFPGRTSKASGWASLRGYPRPDKPWLDGMPRTIFVSDMGDSLSREVSFDYLSREVVDIAASPRGQRHIWQWLTKRPSRMSEFSAWLAAAGVAWPENLWAGTSLTTASTGTRISHLLRVGDERTIRFLSVEPQAEPISLAGWLSQIDWVIQGGESGRESRPFDLEWARHLRDECQSAGVPYFLKQLGAHVVDGQRRRRLRDSHGGDWSEWPEDLRVRQMPLVAQEVQVAIRPSGASGRPRVAAGPTERGEGLRLIVDCEVSGFVGQDLEPWISALAAELARAAWLQDLRDAGPEHPLGCGRWRGALAAAVRANLPKGDYCLNHVDKSELRQVVVEALKPHCTLFARGHGTSGNTLAFPVPSWEALDLSGGAERPPSGLSP
jgi:protein gp37